MLFKKNKIKSFEPTSLFGSPVGPPVQSQSSPIDRTGMVTGQSGPVFKTLILISLCKLL